MNDDDLRGHVAELIVDGGELCIHVLKFVEHRRSQVGDLSFHARDVVFDA
jgi:hypothetical protein